MCNVKLAGGKTCVNVVHIWHLCPPIFTVWQSVVWSPKPKMLLCISLLYIKNNNKRICFERTILLLFKFHYFFLFVCFASYRNKMVGYAGYPTKIFRQLISKILGILKEIIISVRVNKILSGKLLLLLFVCK